MANQISHYSERPHELGLALSGGGFRATLFHLGAAWRLNELALLGSVIRISSVSGGSLLSGLMASRWSRLAFRDGVAANFRHEIAQPIWDFCGRSLDVRAALLSLLLCKNVLPRYYRNHLVGKRTLQDMPDRPEFVFNAAHLETGRNWIFSKAVARTYRLGVIENPEVDLATVLAASSAFPPVFPPVVLELDPSTFRRSEYSDLFDRVDLKCKVSLTDGGLYDNLGVHSISTFGTMLVSDASGPLDTATGLTLLKFLNHRSMRPILIAVEQTRALRRRDSLTKLQRGERLGAWWAVGTSVQDYPLECPFDIAEGWQSVQESTRTRLNSFSTKEKARMINWGYLQCDLSARSYYLKDASPPHTLPYPEFDFSNHPGKAD